MKYIVILGDGMADEPLALLNNKTPLEVAKKPFIDALAKESEVGLVSTIPEGMSPGSDTANLSVMGYDPKIYYTGRSPLEAVSMGIQMKDTDICFRCNVVTLSQEESVYEERTILDHSADEITTEEARELIVAIQEAFGNETLKFYGGISYRHALIWANGSTEVTLTPPHDILERKIGDYLPSGDHARQIHEMMKRSYEILNHHPINIKRAERGLRKANSIWIWGEGKKPSLMDFREKYGMSGAMISAVDLLKGIAIAANMKSIDVEGATGNLHTNFDGKAQACLQALKEGQDFVYVHLEAPDECGHRGELDNKVKSIELIDQKIVKPIVEALRAENEEFRLLILPDHPTPIAYRTHTRSAVPYMIYSSNQVVEGMPSYDESNGKASGKLIVQGHTLMPYFLEQK